MVKYKNFEMIFLCILILLAILLIFEGLAIPVMSDYSIGPGFLPVTIGFGIIVSALSQVVINIAKIKKKDTKYINMQNKEFIDKKSLIKVSRFFGILLVSVLLNPFFGILLPLIIFMVLAFRYDEKYSWFTSIKVALITNIIFYLIFKTWLGVPLPGIFI